MIMTGIIGVKKPPFLFFNSFIKSTSKLFFVLNIELLYFFCLTIISTNKGELIDGRDDKEDKDNYWGNNITFRVISFSKFHHFKHTPFQSVSFILYSNWVNSGEH